MPSGSCSVPVPGHTASGIGLALAGFDRLGSLDMKRSAGAHVRICLRVPYLIGRHRPGVGPPIWISMWLSGALPARAWVCCRASSRKRLRKVGVTGAVLLGFLGLSRPDTSHLCVASLAAAGAEQGNRAFPRSDRGKNTQATEPCRADGGTERWRAGGIIDRNTGSLTSALISRSRGSGRARRKDKEGAKAKARGEVRR